MPNAPLLALIFVAAASAPLAAVPAAPPRVVSTVPADVPQSLLAAHLKADVGVRAHVRRDGTVDSVRAVSGDARLHAAAEASVRWWIFARQPAPAWTLVHVTWDGDAEDEPLSPDVIALARAAERAGDLGTAIDDWCGALVRAGEHPSIRNPYALREHILALAGRLRAPRRIPDSAFGDGQGARILQERTVARADHEDVATTLDKVLLVAPWWGDAYQWRAASEFGCGRAADGLRSLLLYREAMPDRASRDRAERALAKMAAGDTLGACEILKMEGVRYNQDTE